MLQIVQYQKSGEILVEEFPAPVCRKGWILVRTAYSLISAGTEKASVENAQVSMLERAKRQPDQVKLVMDNIKKEGVINTFKKVQSKLDSFKSLGYSASGIVIESQCEDFAVGDLAACGGAGYANHAEIITAPKHLAVKLPPALSLEDAAFTTVGSIAMQGIRQAEPEIGECVAVIGLGLIGQITAQLLKAAGCRVAGLDINTALFEQAKKSGCDEVYPSSNEYFSLLRSFSRGLGFDTVIITAATSSNQPIELALEMCRKKGKVVIVGAIGMNVPRPNFYMKEIDLRIACSYGPGRYDPEYEEGGLDYPPAYVRWTENRNMQAFTDLISSGKIDVRSLTTHTFDISQAQSAYNLVTGKTQEPYLGILIKYPNVPKPIKRNIINPKANEKESELKIGLVGAGTFAQNYLIPPLKKSGAGFVGVSTSKPVNAVTVARQYGFKFSSSDSSDLIANTGINFVFCATQHDTHAKYVCEALRAGKSIFVEKPLAIDKEELSAIESELAKSDGRVMVGFNRRFSKPFVKIKEFFSKSCEPLSMLYRVNAGLLPRSHWVYNQGGRIIGEVCHFIDCMVYLASALPVKVYAEPISSFNGALGVQDNVVITIRFADGSNGCVQYLANCDSAVPKEYFEAHGSRSSAIMNNFTTLELARAGKLKKYSFDGKKGHSEEVIATINAFKRSSEFPISFDVIKAVTNATFAVIESLEKGKPIEIKF